MNKFIKQFFYLLFALPLGIFYFVIIITGLSLGAGLFVIVLGVPIFIGITGFSMVFSKYEVALANNFLDADIPLLSKIESPHGIWATFKARFFDERSWMRIFYLLAKLPLGIATFTIEVTLFAVSLFLILTPFLYREFWYRYVGIGFWHITSMSEALTAVFGGTVLALAFYYITKGLAVVSGEFARSALGDKDGR